MSFITLTPAYGRDYRSGKEVREAFNSGRDFVVASVSSPWCGCYVNKPQLSSGDTVTIYFNRKTKFVVIDI